jgi:hypothetical protein
MSTPDTLNAGEQDALADEWAAALAEAKPTGFSEASEVMQAERVEDASHMFPQLAGGKGGRESRQDIDMILDIPVQLSVELGRTKVLPVTVFAQYRFGEANSAFRPYVGLGVTYAKFFGERTTASLNGLTGGTLANPTTASVDSKWGLTPQIGFVYNFNERWFLDVAYYKSFLKTTAHLSSGQSVSLKLNPNVYAIGIGYRF